MSWRLVLALLVAFWPPAGPFTYLRFHLSCQCLLLRYFLSWTNAGFVRVQGTSDLQVTVTWEAYPNIHTSKSHSLSRFCRYVVNMCSLEKISEENLIISLVCAFLENLETYCKLEAWHNVSSARSSCSGTRRKGTFPRLSREKLEMEFQVGETTGVLTLN